MRKTLAFAAVASLSAFAFMGYDSSVIAQDARARVEVGDAGASGRLSLPQGITRTDRADDAGIRRTLGGAVEALLHQGRPERGFTSYLSSNDRARLNNFTPSDQLAAKIKQFNQDFKAKYNTDFDINDQMVFGDQFRNFYIVQGEVSNPALLSNWPVDARGSTTTTNTEIRTNTNTNTNTNTEIRTNTIDRGNIDNRQGPGTGGPGNPVDPTKAPGAGATVTTGDATVRTTTTDRQGPGTGGPGNPVDPNATGTRTTAGGTVGTTTTDREITTTGTRTGMIDRGMNVAVVSFPASHGAPETHVSLVREGGMAAGGAGAAVREGDVNVRTTTGERGDARLGPGSGGPGNPAQVTNTTGQGNTPNTTTEVRTDTTTTTVDRPGAAANANVGAGEWKLDLPDGMTSDQLQMSLIRHIDEMQAMRDQWPADVNEFYRATSHHLLLALYDTNAGARGAVNIREDRNVDVNRTTTPPPADRNVNVDVDRSTTTTDRKVDVDVRTNTGDNRSKAPGTGGPGNPVQPSDPIDPKQQDKR